MKVVLIKDSDSFFKEGVKLIINNYFHRANCRDLVTFTENSNEESVKYADILILNIPTGTYYLCFPFLKLRKKDNILIIVIDEIVEHKLEDLPHCFENTIIIARHCSVRELTRHLNKRDALRASQLSKPCHSCKRRVLTPLQSDICLGLTQCFSYDYISAHYDVSYKKNWLL